MWARQDSNLEPHSYEPLALPLSYGPEERVRGLEPLMRPWKGRVLPLHHTRMVCILAETLPVGVPGFEPGVSCSQSKRDDQVSLHPVVIGHSTIDDFRCLCAVAG